MDFKLIAGVLFAVLCLGPLLGSLAALLLWYPFGRVAADADARMERIAANFLDEVDG